MNKKATEPCGSTWQLRNCTGEGGRVLLDWSGLRESNPVAQLGRLLPEPVGQARVVGCWRPALIPGLRRLLNDHVPVSSEVVVRLSDYRTRLAHQPAHSPALKRCQVLLSHLPGFSAWQSTPVKAVSDLPVLSAARPCTDQRLSQVYLIGGRRWSRANGAVSMTADLQSAPAPYGYSRPVNWRHPRPRQPPDASGYGPCGVEPQ